MDEIRLRLTDELISQLENEAERERMTVQDYIRRLLHEHTGVPIDEIHPYPNTTHAHLAAVKQAGLRVEEDKAESAPPIPGTAGALLASAQRANLRSGHTDTAERSREILEEEFPDYLSRYQREQNDDE